MAENIFEKDINTAKIIEKAVPKIEQALEIKDNRGDFFAGKKAIIVVIVVVAAIGFAMFQGATYFFSKQVGELVGKPLADEAASFPLNTSEIHFLNDDFRATFADNLTKASQEANGNKRYKYYEDNFVMLLSFYNQTYSYDYRVQLTKFREFIRKAYPNKYDQNHKLYDFNCIDKLCSDAKMDGELAAISEKVKASSAIAPEIRDALVKSFETYVILENKEDKKTTLINSMSYLYSEYSKGHDEGVKGIYFDLKAYTEKNYEGVQIPKEIAIK